MAMKRKHNPPIAIINPEKKTTLKMTSSGKIHKSKPNKIAIIPLSARNHLFL
jgi:hypothetical protein